jgi:FKBP-type peptidyl-prolyl cis-trans isomerase SlyD
LPVSAFNQYYGSVSPPKGAIFHLEGWFMVIEKDRVVSIAYVLKDDSGEILDQSVQNEPLIYVHGNGSLIPGLERELEGKTAGDEINAVIKPEDAYGIREDALVAKVPKANFEGAGEIAVGMQFEARDPHGSHVVTVTEVSGDTVTVDANHPLAGATLHFAVKVEEVREASPEELEAVQHPHSCDCGCDGNCDDEEAEGACGCGSCGH